MVWQKLQSQLCSCPEDAGVSSFEETEKAETPAHGLGETEKVEMVKTGRELGLCGRTQGGLEGG